MKLITDINELVGKTIIIVKTIGWSDCIGLIFDDNTYCIIEGDDDNDHIEVELCTYVNDSAKLELGVITQEEYDNIRLINKNADKKLKEEREVAELKRLSEKYGNTDA